MLINKTTVIFSIYNYVYFCICVYTFKKYKWKPHSYKHSFYTQNILNIKRRTKGEQEEKGESLHLMYNKCLYVWKCKFILILMKYYLNMILHKIHIFCKFAKLYKKL